MISMKHFAKGALDFDCLMANFNEFKFFRKFNKNLSLFYII